MTRGRTFRAICQFYTPRTIDRKVVYWYRLAWTVKPTCFYIIDSLLGPSVLTVYWYNPSDHKTVKVVFNSPLCVSYTAVYFISLSCTDSNFNKYTCTEFEGKFSMYNSHLYTRKNVDLCKEVKKTGVLWYLLMNTYHNVEVFTVQCAGRFIMFILHNRSQVLCKSLSL